MHNRNQRERAYTMVELVVTLALLATLLALAAPMFLDVLRQSKVDQAINELQVIAFEIRLFMDGSDYPPDDLEQINLSHLRDPWGNPYVYYPHRGPGWQGRARKDRFLVPLNNDYDLYSVGPDGESRPPLVNPVSHDDIVRAADGAYFGVAYNF